MIGAILSFGDNTVEIRISGTQVFFRSSQLQQFATIDGLRLDKGGVIKEFPDLENDSQWRTKAIERFKDKMKTYKTESECMNYVINDLTKFGYKPLYLQKQGHRAIKLF